MAPPTAIVTRDSVAKSLTDYFSPQTRQASIAKLISTKALSVESVTTSAIAEVIRDEKLWVCTPQSIFDCVLAASALNLRVGKDLGHAFLVPFRDNKKNETIATFMLGYKGLITLARRSGEIVSITANVVCENDLFDASEGTDGRLVHKPAYFDPRGRGEMLGAYAYAKLTGGGEQWTVMSKAEIDAVRARSRASGGPWVTDYAEMAKKTAVRRLCKMLPIGTQEQEAMAQDDEREFAQARDVTPPKAGKPTLPDVPAQTAPAAPSHVEERQEAVEAVPVAEESGPATTEAPKKRTFFNKDE